jgi:hypothetical protein
MRGHEETRKPSNIRNRRRGCCFLATLFIAAASPDAMLSVPRGNNVYVSVPALAPWRLMGRLGGTDGRIPGHRV